MSNRDLYSIPNLLTYGRILAVPVVAAFMAIGTESGALIAFAIYLAACITDYLDGVAARILNQGSDLGRMLDPIADKLLVAAVLVMLIADGTITGWSLVGAVIIFCREFAVSGLREFLGPRNVVIHVSKLAKWKTTSQLVALGLLILVPVFNAVAMVGLLVFWIATALTLVTGIDYIRQGVGHLVQPDPSTTVEREEA